MWVQFLKSLTVPTDIFENQARENLRRIFENCFEPGRWDRSEIRRSVAVAILGNCASRYYAVYLNLLAAEKVEFYDRYNKCSSCA